MKIAQTTSLGVVDMHYLQQRKLVLSTVNKTEPKMNKKNLSNNARSSRFVTNFHILQFDKSMVVVRSE